MPQVDGTSSSCIQVQLEADIPLVHRQKAPKRGKCLGCVCLPARTPHAGKKVQLAAQQHMACPLQKAYGDFQTQLGSARHSQPLTCSHSHSSCALAAARQQHTTRITLIGGPWWFKGVGRRGQTRAPQALSVQHCALGSAHPDRGDHLGFASPPAHTRAPKRPLPLKDKKQEKLVDEGPHALLMLRSGQGCKLSGPGGKEHLGYRKLAGWWSGAEARPSERCGTGRPDGQAFRLTRGAGAPASTALVGPRAKLWT